MYRITFFWGQIAVVLITMVMTSMGHAGGLSDGTVSSSRTLTPILTSKDVSLLGGSLTVAMTIQEERKTNMKDREKSTAEWKTILKDHPAFARVLLSEQAILIEASQLGFKLVDRSMCRLMQTGLPVLFEEYWASRCKQQVGEIRLSEQIECITEGNRDPSRCFNLDPGDPPWFDDPLAGGQTLPPKPPVSPLRPSN